MFDMCPRLPTRRRAGLLCFRQFASHVMERQSGVDRCNGGQAGLQERKKTGRGDREKTEEQTVQGMSGESAGQEQGGETAGQELG